LDCSYGVLLSKIQKQWRTFWTLVLIRLEIDV